MTRHQKIEAAPSAQDVLAALKANFADLERRAVFGSMGDDVFCAFAEALDTFADECGKHLDAVEEARAGRGNPRDWDMSLGAAQLGLAK